MTTATAAFNAVRARLEAGATIPLRWQNEDGDPLPDAPAAFAYVEFNVGTAAIAAYGGGRGRNRYRNFANVDVFVFVPRGQGLQVATDYAEALATLLRSYRDSDISCISASVLPGGNGADMKPPGLSSEVDNYFWATAEIELWFDQIG